MRIMLVTICVLVALVVLVVGASLWNHSQLRRSVLFDRQALFHSSDVFHVVSALKLKPGRSLVSNGVRFNSCFKRLLPQAHTNIMVSQ